MPRPTIDQLRSLPDFVSVYRWNVGFIFPTALVGAPTSDDLNVRCVSTDVPKRTNNKMEVSVRGHKVRQAGITDYPGTTNLVFVETIDNKLKLLIRSWAELYWQVKTGVWAGAKSTLEGQIILTQLNNQDVGIWQWTTVGARVEDFDYGSLDDSSNEAHKPSMVIGWDYYDDKAL